MARYNQNQILSIPAPVGGWNPTIGLASMTQADATILENFIPRAKYIELRKGCSEHSTGNSTSAVETLIAYTGNVGTYKLLAFAGGKIYDATATGASTQIATGFTEDRWNGVMFLDKLVLVNGTDQPQQYDPTAGVTTAAYTGIADDSVFISVSVFNSRLYFVEKLSTSIWYPSVSAITGAVTELNVGDQLSLGGHIVFGGSWANDTGAGVEDLFVIATSEGEILLYSGSYPGDADWEKVGRFTIGKLLGNRAVKNIAGDIVFITEFGVERLSDLIGKRLELGGLSTKINEEFSSIVPSYGTNTGWEIAESPVEQVAILNVPTATNTSAYQYGVNTITGGWFKITGWDATCLCEHNGAIYFGASGGKVFKAFASYTDDGAPIEARVRTSFSYLNDPSSIKLCHLVKPMLQTNATTSLSVGVDVDFEETTADFTTIDLDLSESSESLWDVAEWNVGEWASYDLTPVKQYYGVSGIGVAMAIRVLGKFSGVSLRITGFLVTYQSGGSL